PSGGHVAFAFVVGPDADVAGHLDGAGGTTADYHFTRAADGAGTFRLAQPDRLVTSRWNASGAGRADARFAGGQATECWDANFRRVFFVGVPAGGPPQSEGDPAACAFADPL